MSTKVSPVKGYFIDVEVAGETYEVFYTENGQGIPLLCQHTAGSHSQQWRNLIRDPEITKNYRVIAYDLPYHGKSEPPHGKEWWKEDYKLTIDFFTEFIVKLSDALGLDKPAFIACSMGGVVCLHLALRYPEKFRALIAMESADYTPGFYIKWWAHPEINGNELVSSVIEGLTAPQTPELERRLNMWYYSQAAPGITKGDLYFYSVEHDLRDKVHEIDTSKVPLYMLTGEYDYLSTPQQSEDTAKKIKGAKYQTMKELGHFPMIEDYEKFKSYIAPILEEIKTF